ncbi:hypothetical protein MHYP_G00155400 [Metynnis hypsauchen]
MRDQILTNLSVVNPENQDDVAPQQIMALAERFPNVIKADVREKLHLEVLDYVSTNLEALVPNYRNLPVEELWGKLSNVRSVSSGQLKFAEPCKLMKLLLVLPNSNCDVERAFSMANQKLLSLKRTNRIARSGNLKVCSAGSAAVPLEEDGFPLIFH